MTIVINLGLHGGRIGGIFITGIFGNFYTKRGGGFGLSKREFPVTLFQSVPPPLVWGHTSHVSFLSTPSASRCRRLQNYRAPREWFPGPRCGCQLAWLKSEDRANFTINCLYSHKRSIQWFEWPKQYLSVFYGRFSVREIKLLPGEVRQCQLPLQVSNETNNCLHTLYRSKFTAPSRGLPATARISSCLSQF